MSPENSFPIDRGDDLKLDLGCGMHKKQGFLGVDLSADCQADIMHDLRIAPWPFAANQVAEVHCSHFFEHLDGRERMAFMNELWRVMKPGAKAVIITPYWNTLAAIQDPTHAWPPVCETSYNYFNKQWRELSGVQHYPIHCDFELAILFSLEPEWNSGDKEQKSFALKYQNRVVRELHVTLTRLPA